MGRATGGKIVDENPKRKDELFLQVVKSRKKRIAAPEPEPQWGGFNQGFNQQVAFLKLNSLSIP